MKSSKLVLTLCLLTISVINCVYYNHTTHLTSMNNLYLKHYYNPIYNQTIDFIRYLSETKELNSECRSSLKKLIHGVSLNEFWALKCKIFFFILKLFSLTFDLNKF